MRFRPPSQSRDPVMGKERLLYSAGPNRLGRGRQICITSFRQLSITLLVEQAGTDCGCGATGGEEHPRGREKKAWRAVARAEKLVREWRRPQNATRLGCRSCQKEAEAAAGTAPMAEGRTSQADVQQEIIAACRLANSTYSLYDSHKKNLWITDDRRQRYLTRTLPAVWSRSDPSGKSAHGGDLPQAVH